jgi:hypothetical protein
MKKIFIAAIGLVMLSGQADAQQKKQSGAIQFVSTFDPAAMAEANGMKLSEEMLARMPKSSKTEFELLFNATNASYMKAEEIEDSNGGGGGPAGGMRFGGFGAASRDLYFDFLDHKLTEVFDLRDTTYFLQTKLGAAAVQPMRMGNGAGTDAALPPQVVTTVTKSDETKKILGFNCNKVVITKVTKRKIQDVEREITDQTTLWYTKELGFDFSPKPELWIEGAVLAVEGKGSNVLATSIEYRNVNSKDVNLPKKGTLITTEQYREKLDRTMRQMRGNRNGQGARQVITN